MPRPSTVTRLVDRARRLARRPVPGPPPGWSAEDLDPEAFVRRAYREILGREADEAGLATQLAALRAGAGRTDVLLGLVRSPELRLRLARADEARTDLPDLCAERPERYRHRPEPPGRTTFVARDADDLAWLEGRIHDTGYYRAGGVWVDEVDDEKRRMADLVAGLVAGPGPGPGPSDRRPARVLELGCYTGALLVALLERGLDPYGVELTTEAAARADARVRDRIVVGDLVDAAVEGPFDVVVGLDIFEHVTPARLARALDALAARLAPGGLVVANIPAFGADDVFGTVFERYLPSWEADAAAGRWFAELDCDERGYPRNGHLIWADTSWWEDAFAAAGLVRDRAAERAVQAAHAAWWRAHAPARRSLYVFRPRTS